IAKREVWITGANVYLNIGTDLSPSYKIKGNARGLPLGCSLYENLPASESDTVRFVMDDLTPDLYDIPEALGPGKEHVYLLVAGELICIWSRVLDGSIFESTGLHVYSASM